MRKINVYTDGACSGNPGNGGWAYIVEVQEGDHFEKFAKSGSAINVTNNQMELMAVIEALRDIRDKFSNITATDKILITSDSKYAISGSTEWRSGWERRGWKNSKGQPVANRQMWERLYSLIDDLNVRWKWVKGHAGHPQNETCDMMATAEVNKLKLKESV